MELSVSQTRFMLKEKGESSGIEAKTGKTSVISFELVYRSVS